MDEHFKTDEIASTGSIEVEILPKPVTAMTIYSDILKRRDQRSDEKKKKKEKNKGGGKKGKKGKKDLDLDLYDDYINNIDVIAPNAFNPFLLEQNRFREGNVVPEELDLNLYEDSGFFFGRKYKPNGFVGKPAHEDGHIMIDGVPGSGKTMAIVIPSMMTWKGFQILIDVKGNLHKVWKLLNRHTGKKVKVFRPGSLMDNSCKYDAYSLFHKGGPENVPGNSRDLALALMPLMEGIKEEVWIVATQAFLTGAFIYYYEMGLSFVDTMVEIQLSSITELIDEIMDGDNVAAKIQVSKLSEVSDKVIVNIGMELSKLATLVTDPAIISAFSAEEGCDLIDWLELNTTTEPYDIILELPDAKLEQWKPMTMLMINQLIKALEQRPERTYNKGEEAAPVLVMLDEFARLGKVSAIKNGLATLRDRGVTFALFIQGMAQMDEIYGIATARVIAEICAYKIVLNVAEPISQKYFSDLVGTTESTQRSVNVTNDPSDGRVIGLGRGINETREPIIYPHEFLTQKDVVVINPFNRFCRVDKTLFIENKDLFIRPQLLKNSAYTAQKLLPYSYNAEGGNNYD